MSKQLNATRNEFQKSYRSHYSTYKNNSSEFSISSRRLLLFYSVECGLKSLILKQIGKNTYSDLKIYSETQQKRVHGHDIKAMAKEIGINHLYPIKRIRLSNQKGYVTPDSFNQLWRYGVSAADKEEEKKAESVLNEIAIYIGKRL